MAGLLPSDALFLGFDSSTQSLKATVLDGNLIIIHSESVHFDTELPHYRTKDGVYRDPSGNGRIVSPTLMWVEALDVLLEKLKSKVDYGKVVAISGSGQQHGSVYWNKRGKAILTSLDPKKPLRSQLEDAFSVRDSPIWMDSSTTSQCRELEKAVGGALELSKLTGSRAYERYTGPQIRKIYQTQPDVYNDTERISLVSSFVASILIGNYASIDETDGAGMNLMDIKQRVWSKTILEATAPGLEEKLGHLAPAHAVAGLISSYFVESFILGMLSLFIGFQLNYNIYIAVLSAVPVKVLTFAAPLLFHFQKSCIVIQWSGDNPNSLAGLTLNTPGDLAISLGTSDTVFGITSEPQPSLEGHVFPNPVDPNCYMVMLVYKNGSLTREDVRNRCAESSWDTFNKYLERTPSLNGGKLGFYYKEHEILPPLPVGFHRYVLENVDSLNETKVLEVQEFDPPSEVRAIIEGQFLSMRGHAERFGMPTPPNRIIEGQFLSMRGHAERFGMPTPPNRIIATGGASKNESILKSIASIFGCPVYTVQRPDSASLGAALRAAHGWLCHKEGRFVPISCLYGDKLDKTSMSAKLAFPAGDADLLSKYTVLVNKRMQIEKNLVEKLGRS
ncbi:FGGY family of carbohydrate kinases, C-terminal domain [Musa troglodytarum]|uniref:Xylulose kinase n=1 Tax=Musa troglodytarum TaxID=320322 RepID=A0A9E7FLL5_9LILI|nr:FGGY family of carbohydrate kinases, C-terminal domain [Musa troglodytarum]